MLTSEKFGYVGPFAWLADQSSVAVVILACLAIAPLASFVLAPVLEARWMPWDWGHQFKAFFPGDIFLSLAVASLLWHGRSLPAEKLWYNSSLFHSFVFRATLGFAAWQTWREAKADPTAAFAWPQGVALSPTKLYHNFALYCVYGYLVVTALVPFVASGQFGVALIAVDIAVPWMYFLLFDNQAAENVRLARLEQAHIANWRPIWANGWHVRTMAEVAAERR